MPDFFGVQMGVEFGGDIRAASPLPELLLALLLGFEGIALEALLFEVDSTGNELAAAKDDDVGEERMDLAKFGLRVFSGGAVLSGGGEAPLITKSGDWLCLSVKLDKGEELLLAIETGSPFTVLDKSLESKLGKRLGTTNSESAWYGKWLLNEYAAPKLYLGNALLLTGDRIRTGDLNHMRSALPVQGFLGLDCLKHYCFQMDFTVRKIRFFEPNDLRAENLGATFPIEVSSVGAPTRGDFFGIGDLNILVDTGCTGDGALQSSLFDRELRKRTNLPEHHGTTPTGKTVRYATFPQPNGDTFVLSDCPDASLLGLGFLQRYMVTLNFPQRKMYLSRRSPDSLTDAAAQFLQNLIISGELPGWQQTDGTELAISARDEEHSAGYPVFRTGTFAGAQGESVYHCTVMQSDTNSPWHVQRAWRTGTDGRLIQEYPGAPASESRPKQ